jgi:MYXO-CTERM domain-containing protein
MAGQIAEVNSTARLVAALAGVLVSSGGLAAAGTDPAWVGDFTGFNTPDWRARWGIIPDTLVCDVATGRAPCNWGYPNLKVLPDPGVPGGGQALEVTYPAPSGPPSCKCGIGGAQLYQDLAMNGMGDLIKSPSIDFKYYYKFPVGFDFGGNTAGKMPGLYGGPPGCESGGQRCPKAWSTRYMWRGGSQAAPNGELYFYTAAGSGFGSDLGGGSWKFLADGQWHSMEQLVNLMTGKIVIWHDGKMAYTTTQSFGGGTLTGIFFSTFHGGHDTGWSPRKLTTAQFANFSLSTDGPQPAAGTPPPPADDDAGAPPAPADAAVTTPPAGPDAASSSADAGQVATPVDAPTPPSTPSPVARPSKSSGGCSYGQGDPSTPLPLLLIALLLRRRR